LTNIAVKNGELSPSLFYEYDPVTGLKTRTWTEAGTETVYGYDSLNRLATVSSVGNAGGTVVTNTTSYTYTAVGSRDTVTLPNGVTTRYVYDDLNRLTSLAHFNYDDNDRLIREESAVSLASLAVTPSGQMIAGAGGGSLLRSTAGLGRLASQTAALAYRPLPGFWASVAFHAIPVCMLLAFILPILTGAPGLRRCRILGADRLLVSRRLPLFMRGTAALLAANMLLVSLPFETLAQEYDIYSQLDAANWGQAGSITLYAYDANGSLVSKSVTGGGAPCVETYTYDLQIN